MQINFEKITFSYNKNTPYENQVLNDITLKIKSNSFTTVLGKTGSGKSTLIEHINGLLIAQKGQVVVDDLVIKYYKNRKDKALLETKLRDKRQKIAMLFQFSEQQLFEDTVLKDIMFAPLNYGKTKEEAKKIAKSLIKLVGLNEKYLYRSPFELSGGEMRKVALCGVLALEPEILVLDEPTIGLDFKSKNEFLKLIYKIYKEKNITVIFITHNMDYVLKYATDIIIMKNGEIAYTTDNKEDFLLEINNNNYNLSIPDIIKIQYDLISIGVNLSKIHYEYQNFIDEIKQKIGNNL